MNEQRTQTYLNLINQLLSCNDGDEPRILQENRELLDEGLVQVMVAVAQQYGEAGRENEAQFLMNIAKQLAAALGLSGNETTATANTPQDYLNFLMETLQKISENPNPQLIYPFWAQNLDKLDDNLAQILDSRVREILTQVTPEQAYFIAFIIGNFSNLIAQFPLGNIATHKEIAITGYEIALNIFTFDAFPQEWAMTENSLAAVYYSRIRGEKADNLEKAIAAYQEALKVLTFDAFPQDWAMTQNNLALAYSDRIRGEKAENLEMAIAAYQEALKVYTFDAFPQQWARIQNNLAIAYSNRIRGDKAENIKQAVMCYQNALQGYETAGDFLNAAEMGLTLGKIKVDRGEWYQGLAYLEKSLKIYRQFDDLKSRADTIYQIAHTHHLIGNHEKASIYYRDALRFYEYLKHDRGVAFCQASLGRLMLQIGFVEKAEELLKKATFIFKELNNEQEIAKIAEVLNCLAKIKEKQAV
ncbi:tetratricopeptide repeat protein [Microcystis aeruginosa]|uniref:TPR repeat n=1 Tax=Microcystis aeruginosa NIES-3787 TaxID=2517782 RepID=A0A6H9FPZ4_MICAE|nr:tetratricopeptide repeat-containing protein [Microcystis aeruginosa]GCL45048.1 TPR repeat precursor [Microcystis aeruginosa NIES-3787]